MYTSLTLDHLDSLEQRTLWPGFGDLVRRARGLLHDRSPDKISYALDAVNFILDDPKNEIATNTAFAKADSPFLAQRLQKYAPHYDIGRIRKFPNATWTELFAVLALGLLEEAAQTFHGWPTAHPPDWYPKYPIEDDPSVQDVLLPVDAYSFACFLAAVEALAFAQAQERITVDVKTQIKLRGQEGGIARHAKSRAIEEDFFRYYQTGTFPSVRAAAKQYCDEHENIFDILIEDNAVRTLTDYYSRRARELGIKPREKPVKDA